jgi:hypothetical protein
MRPCDGGRPPRLAARGGYRAVWASRDGRHVTPRLDEVARSVRVAAQALAEFTEYEETWARIATDGRTDIETISESESAPRAASILEQWRAVERQLDDIEPGSPESARLFAEFERLRDEYLAVFQEREERDPE